MRISLPLFALLLLAAPLFGQSSICISAGATIVDTASTQLVLSDSYSARGSTFIATDAESSVTWEYIASRPLSGGIDIHIPVDSIRVTGDGSQIDSLSTVALFDLIAQTSIVNSLSQGHFSCNDSCPGSTVRVFQKACVQRLGTGNTTHFIPCSSSPCCARTYKICCPAPNAAPVLAPVQSTSGSCISGSSGCESTCP